jgi:hypothetical protein
VKADVELFPKQHRYKVNGSYLLVNKTASKIDSVLLYVDPTASCESLIVPNAQLLINDSRFHHWRYQLYKPLLPGDSLIISFSLSSTWSPFGQHTAFNSIIKNGSFIRMSKYFPRFGYQEENEIDNLTEREKRKLGPAAPLRQANAAEKDPYNFINLDVVVSTDEDQTAIGSGELINQWRQQGRNYFHYRTNSPIPFRFAFSSAKYVLKKAFYKNIAIEIYYDAGHLKNVDRLIKNAQQTLKYAEHNFGPYPYESIRFAEISSFATGFGATAYPSVIFMKEDMGFDSDLRKPGELDVINQLAGHELSHIWWGVAQLSPDQREGYGMMTETLAQYTELMLYKKMHRPVQNH